MAIERLGPSTGGWVTWQGTDFPFPVLVCFRSDKKGRLYPTKVHVSGKGEAVTARLLRDVPLGRIETWANAPDMAELIRAAIKEPAPDLERIVSGCRPLPTSPPSSAPDMRLDIPDTFRYPDEFYEQVAAVYQEAATVYARPAREIADENGVPLATVQRWVKEARKRKILGPGRPRKET